MEFIDRAREAVGLTRNGIPADPPPLPLKGGVVLTDDDVAGLVDENNQYYIVGSGTFTVSTPPPEPDATDE